MDIKLEYKYHVCNKWQFKPHICGKCAFAMNKFDDSANINIY